LFNRFNSVTVFPKSAGSIVATLTLLTSPATKVPAINWVYWSLVVELFFYLVMAAAKFFNAKTAKIFVIVVSMATFIPNVDSVPGLFFFKHWASFGLGLSLYYFNLKNKSTYPLSLTLFIVNICNLLAFHGIDAYTVVSILSVLIIFISIWIKDIPSNIF